MGEPYIVEDTSVFSEISIRVFPWARIGHKIGGLETPFEKKSQHHRRRFMPMGAYSYSHSVFEPVSRIGRYCSIGENVKVMGDRHPVSWVSTNPINYSARRRKLLDIEGENRNLSFPHAPNPVEIGNDVWIGTDVLLRDGIKIGDGSVIAAGSVVVKDVAPYSIVGGNPATHIRNRFADEICTGLLETQWWQYKYDSMQHLNFKDPEDFLRGLENNKDVLIPLEEQRLTILEHIKLLEDN